MSQLGWTRFAEELDGPRFVEFQVALTHYNGTRLRPSLPEEASCDALKHEHAVAQAEVVFIEAQRKVLRPLTADVPSDTDAFMTWYERLKETGPGQGDPLFPWLATSASAEQMKWFLHQEVAGEAGVADLLAVKRGKRVGGAQIRRSRARRASTICWR